MSGLRLPHMLARVLGAGVVAALAHFTFGLTNNDVVVQAVILLVALVVVVTLAQYLTHGSLAWNTVVLTGLAGMTVYLLGNATGTAPCGFPSET